MISEVDRILSTPSPSAGSIREIYLAEWALPGTVEVLIACQGFSATEVDAALDGRGEVADVTTTDDRFLASVSWLSESQVLGVVQFGQAYNWSEDPTDWEWVPCLEDFPPVPPTLLSIENATIELGYDTSHSIPSWYLAGPPSTNAG